MDRAEIFHRLPHLADSRLAEIFAREVLRLLVGKGLLSPEWEGRFKAIDTPRKYPYKG